MDPVTHACPDPVDLESIITTAELNRRPPRPPEYEAENRALGALAQEMASSPRGILGKLAETALDLCRAQSAGISLLENDRKRFYWSALAGRWAPHLGGGTPRDYGPCATVLDRSTAVLFSHPERYFTYLAPVTPPIEEALLLPFYVNGEAIGTVWVITHDGSRRFDAEDLRLLNSLGKFASAAYQVLSSVNALEATGVVLRASQERYRALVEATTQAVWSSGPEGQRADEGTGWWCELTGQTPAGARGLGWLDALHPHDRAQAAASWTVALAERQPLHVEYRVRSRSGEYRSLIARGVPVVLGEDGRVREWIGTFTDVTEQRRAEERLRQAANIRRRKWRRAAAPSRPTSPAAVRCASSATAPSHEV